jgi:hypothetical protein
MGVIMKTGQIILVAATTCSDILEATTCDKFGGATIRPKIYETDPPDPVINSMAAELFPDVRESGISINLEDLEIIYELVSEMANEIKFQLIYKNEKNLKNRFTLDYRYKTISSLQEILGKRITYDPEVRDTYREQWKIVSVQ